MLKQLATAGFLLSALAFATTAGAAGYGSSSSSSSSAPMMTPPHMQSSSMMMAPAHLMRTAKGRIWVDARGFALYTFAKDPPGKSTCYGACAVAWPPFRAPMGAHASGKWSVVYRMGMFGAQWAYNGKPLYFWFKDTAPGQVTGDGVDGFHVAR